MHRSFSNKVIIDNNVLATVKLHCIGGKASGIDVVVAGDDGTGRVKTNVIKQLA